MIVDADASLVGVEDAVENRRIKRVGGSNGGGFGDDPIASVKGAR